jgi:hypothetical protein
LQLISPSTSPNELNTTLTPHSIIHGDACFAYFNKIWDIPRAQQVTKEVSYANLNEMPVIDIAKYLGSRVVRRLKRTIGSSFD